MERSMSACDLLASGTGSLFALLCALLALARLAAIAAGFALQRRSDPAHHAGYPSSGRDGQTATAEGLAGVWRLYRRLGVASGPSRWVLLSLGARTGRPNGGDATVALDKVVAKVERCPAEPRWKVTSERCCQAIGRYP